MKLFIRKGYFAFKMLRTGTGILLNVKIIIRKIENTISFSHWTDEKSGNPEKVGRMASLNSITKKYNI